MRWNKGDQRNHGEPVTDESLADILRHYRDSTGTSSRAMSRAAQTAGHRLSYTTIDAILNGEHTGTYKPYTLDAIAFVCNVPRDRVYKAAGRTLPSNPFADELPEGVDDLDPYSRRAVIGVIRALLRGQETSPDVSPADDSGGRVVPLRAARKRPKSEQIPPDESG